MLLDVTNLLAVLGSQFIDAAFGFDLVIELQQAQGFIEISHGQESVAGEISSPLAWTIAPKGASYRCRPIPCHG